MIMNSGPNSGFLFELGLGLGLGHMIVCEASFACVQHIAQRRKVSVTSHAIPSANFLLTLYRFSHPVVGILHLKLLSK